MFIFVIWMSAHLGKWSSWSSIMKNKSPEMLRKRALTHRFQPEYENNEAFTYWAKQFLSSEEVERLHEKYGESEAGERREARIVLRVDEEGGPPPPPPGE